MTEQTEIESWAIGQFSELINFGFSQPVLTREGWTTVIDWIGTDIALELELDWREFDAFLLIVRLEGGQLPQGYYVSDGKPCRFHLQKLIRESGWSVSLDEMKAISPDKKSRQPAKTSAESLRRRLLAYKAVLMSCINQLLANRESLFLERTCDKEPGSN